MYRVKLFAVFAVALAVVATLTPPSLVAAQEDPAEARKAQILANLKLAFPQLEQLGVVMNDITSSPFEGLDEGSFTVQTPRGPNNQKFLVAADNTRLFLVGEPIDVSRSPAEIKAELAKRAEEKARAAAERSKELEASIAGLPVRGNPDAPVTIIEFSDFQCPYCSRGAATVEQILQKYPDDVKFVFKHFPLNFHPWAKPAAIASRCAAQQNPEAFWTLHDQYFAQQKELTPENVIEKSKEYLADAGIDMEAWASCANDPESEAYKAAAAAIDADMEFGAKMGVTGTPGFFVNGEFLNGAQPITAFEPLIEKAKDR